MRLTPAVVVTEHIDTPPESQQLCCLKPKAAAWVCASVCVCARADACPEVHQCNRHMRRILWDSLFGYKTLLHASNLPRTQCTQFVMPVNTRLLPVRLPVRHTEVSYSPDRESWEREREKRGFSVILCKVSSAVPHIPVCGHSCWPEHNSGETQFSETSSAFQWRSITTRSVPTRPLVTATDCFLLCRPLSGVWQRAPGQHLTINQRAQPLLIACRLFPGITHKQ